MAVANVDVVDGERVAIDGLNDGLQFGVVAHACVISARNWPGSLGLTVWSRSPVYKRILQGKPDLLGHHVVGVVRLLHRGVQQLARVDQRNSRGDDEHQRRDGQNEFGLETHDSGGAVIRAGAAILLEFVVQRLQADAQNLRGARLVLSGGLKRAQNQQPLGLVHRGAHVDRDQCSRRMIERAAGCCLPKPGGRWPTSSGAPSGHRITARSMVLRSSRALPGQS